MTVKTKRKIEKPPIEKDTCFVVLGIHWDESHEFDYLVKHNGKTVSVSKSDVETV